jgi:endonuclease-3
MINNITEKINIIYNRLSIRYNSKIELNYTSSIELLIATMLSVQCTDKVVNRVTDKLFKKYKNIYDYANADITELKNDIKAVGLFNKKAENIINSCKTIIKEYNSKVPNSLDDLIKLNGVGRKIANIVLSNIYNINEGIAIDTHMLRINYRLGIITSNKYANQAERELMKILPRNLWNEYTYLIINHGRLICLARKPKCDICFLNDICSKNGF